MLERQQQSLDVPAPDGRRGLPLRIYALGRFSVVQGVEPIHFVRKAQRRSLQLLKALIALGGRAVATDRLAMAMWPESEGDAAYNALEITLHRLRKLIGVGKALVLRDGLLTLDNRHCWVDVWAFEQAASRTEALLRSPSPDPDELDSLSSRVVELYHGHFLGLETPEPWSISLRERLRSIFLRHLAEVGRCWERSGRHEAAIQCYQKGLELDDLAEIFYQRLMNCYEQLGRRSEALAVYRRCRATLSLVLSVAPSAATEAIHGRLAQA